MRVFTLSRLFFKEATGTVSIIFALSLIVIMGIAGLAVDSSRKSNVTSKLQDVADASALAGARHYSRTGDRDAAIAAATIFFKQGVAKDPKLATAVLSSVDLDKDKREISVAANYKMPTTIASLFNVNQFSLKTRSKATAAAEELEISIMIDLSSSMTGQRFSNLKTALNEFAEQVMPDQADDSVKIAFAPFASAVNVSSYFTTATGAAPASTTCVGERFGSAQYTDEPPASGRYFNVFVPESGWPCLNATLMPLQSSKATVLSRINGLALSEGTAGHLGTMWSWFLLSPKWENIWPAASRPKPYGDIRKVVIVMTDGENFPKDVSDEESDSYARNVCTGMKSAGVTVFTIGFHVEVNRAKSLLMDCASSPEHHYFPSGGTELSDAFREIADTFSRLRLTQ